MKYKLIRFKYHGSICYTIADKLHITGRRFNTMYSLQPKTEIINVITTFLVGKGFYDCTYEHLQHAIVLFEFDTEKELKENYPEYFI
jgi:hypothetical protein